MPDFEVALPLGAIAFYVYDSVMLLYDNEVVFRKRLKTWDWTLGIDLFIFGKRVSAPGLFFPWSLLLRSYWTEKARTGPKCEPEKLAAIESLLLPVRILCTMMLLLLILGLPFTALVRRGLGPEMLAVFISFYLLVATSLAILIMRRRQLGLDRKALLALSIDALACAPFAINLVGKVSLRTVSLVDPLHFSRTHCGTEGDRALRSVLAARVDALLESGATEQRDDRTLREFAARLRSEEA